ncbi:MAG: proline iminopeptidase-family hydrolase [Atopobiaceae bacterium]|nr:proline iminopeptidase-family hydrolase [Atopobiaceae bacterium]
MPVAEGYVPFKGFRTYWRAVGDLGSPKPALLLLHGGPGSTHTYFEMLDRLAAETGRAVVCYDQIGCGNSFVENRPDLWVAETWVDELETIREALGLDSIHLLGQSWGGMLAITYLVDRKPEGIRSVILSSTLSDSQLWGREQHRMAKQLPEAEWRALIEAEESGVFKGVEYSKAVGHYMELHCCDLEYGEDAPECLRRKTRSGREAYETAWGPNELTPTGTLASWSYTDRLPEIEEPALIFSGTDDLSTPLLAKTMFDRLPDARWELMEGCRHMCYVDDNDRYSAILSEWMEEHD